MSEKNNGGQAFPEVTELVYSTSEYPHYKVWGSEGMTLRDYFAAKALPRFIAHDRNRRAVSEPDVAAQQAYEYADAMLRARNA